jgi:type II secretory pathway pseudopilin PulG
MVTTVSSITPLPPDPRGEDGFTLLGVLIAVAVINIALGVATVRWSMVMKRQREIELIWRGEQYARALDCYRQQEQTLPTELEELVDARCLRRLYTDPVSKDGPWEVIRAGDLTQEEAERLLAGGADDAPAAPDAEPPPAERRGLRARLGSASSDRRRPSSRTSVSSDRQGGLAERLRSSRSEQTGRARRSRAGGMRGNAAKQIVGVVSTSSAEALRERDDKRHYDEWRFMLGSAPSPSVPGWVPSRTEDPTDEGQTDAPDPSPKRGLRSRRRTPRRLP